MLHNNNQLLYFICKSYTHLSSSRAILSPCIRFRSLSFALFLRIFFTTSLVFGELLRFFAFFCDVLTLSSVVAGNCAAWWAFCDNIWSSWLVVTSVLCHNWGVNPMWVLSVVTVRVGPWKQNILSSCWWLDLTFKEPKKMYFPKVLLFIII